VKINLSGLSKLYQEYLEDRRSAARSLCPDPERLIRSVMMEAPPNEKAEIIEHVASCPACADVAKGLLRISAEIDVLAEHVAEQASILSRSARKYGSSNTRIVSFWMFRKALGAIFVGLISVAIVAFFVFRERDNPSTRGGQLKMIQTIYPIKVSVPENSIQFRWRGIAGASYYRIDLFDKSLAPVWQSSQVKGNSIRVSVTKDMKIIAGNAYYWMVTAVLSDRTKVTSKLVEFSVKR
jgi:hypothetical protein